MPEEGCWLTRRVAVLWARVAGLPLRWREVGLAFCLFLAYEVGRFLRVTDPLANSAWLWEVEQRFGWAIEEGLQEWLLASPWLVDAMAWYYIPMHVAPFIGLFFYHLWRLDDSYWTFRRAAYGVIAPAIVVFSVFPVAPPRSLPDTGLVDLVGGSGAPSLDAPLVGQLANQVGAFPSEHVTWAVVVAYTLTRLHDVRWLPLAVLHVVITCVAVTATGHHYVVDVAAGLVLGGLGIWFAEKGSLPGEPDDVVPDEERPPGSEPFPDVG